MLGLKRYPFIDGADESIEDRFIQNYYYLNEPEFQDLHEQSVEGLAVAFLYNTLAISLTHRIWDKTEIALTENAENSVTVRHISQPSHVDFHQGWIDENRPIALVQTKLSSTAKIINLRDDHGKDILEHFANRLINSPYIVSVINSLPFNPHERNFVRRIYPDGTIELVLVKTDQGLGVVVQTTGRNLQETQAIANLMEESYG